MHYLRGIRSVDGPCSGPHSQFQFQFHFPMTETLRLLTEEPYTPGPSGPIKETT